MAMTECGATTPERMQRPKGKMQRTAPNEAMRLYWQRFGVNKIQAKLLQYEIDETAEINDSTETNEIDETNETNKKDETNENSKDLIISICTLMMCRQTTTVSRAPKILTM